MRNNSSLVTRHLSLLTRHLSLLTVLVTCHLSLFTLFSCQDSVPLASANKPTLRESLTSQQWEVYRVLRTEAGSEATDVTIEEGTPRVRFRLDSTVVWTYSDSSVVRRWKFIDTATRDIELQTADRVPSDTIRLMSFIGTFLAIRTVSGDTTQKTGWKITDFFHKPSL